MIVDVLTLIGIMSAITLVSGFFTFRFYRREKKQTVIEFEQIVHGKLQEALDSMGEVFQDIFTQPTVKKAFSIIGSQGGQAKAEAGLVDKIATDVINGPQFAAIKMGAKGLLGIDVDQYVEENGAMQTLAAINQVAGFMGMDVQKMVGENLGGMGAGSMSTPGDNYYLRR